MKYGFRESGVAIMDSDEIISRLPMQLKVSKPSKSLGLVIEVCDEDK